MDRPHSHGIADAATIPRFCHRWRTVVSHDGRFISSLGWLSESENQLAVNRLLRTTEPDAPGGRYYLYVCPECVDLGCGAVTAVIDRVGDSIVWRDFGIQNNIDETVYKNGFEEIGPFSFNATDYYDTITTAFEISR